MGENNVTQPVVCPVSAREVEITDFFTSFEEGDKQPTWENTVETDSEGKKMASGIKGIPYDSIQGNISHLIEEVSAIADKPPNEEANNLADHNKQTKWLACEISNMNSEIGDGPNSSYTGKVNAGWTGGKALRYSGRHVPEYRAYSYNKVFDVKIAVPT